MSDRLVTVVGPHGKRDLNLPAETPIDDLLPGVLEAVGAVGNGEAVETERWRLARAANGERALTPASSLEEAGILDGAKLFLTRGPRCGPGVDVPELGFLQRLTGAIRAFVFWTERDEPDAPPADARPVDALRPSAPSPASLTALPSLTRVERARQVWRGTSYVEQLDARIRGPRLAGCATVAVVSPKGGVGKTTTAALLGMLLTTLRADRVVAVDANPDYGSLGRTLVPKHELTADSFLDLAPETLTATELEARLGRAQHGLLVLPAPTDPARMGRLGEHEYGQIIEQLQRVAGVLLLDCGTGLLDAPTTAAISACDQIVLVTDADPAAASLVAEAGNLLSGAQRPITVVVNKVPRKRSFLALDEFEAAVPFTSAFVVVPNEPHAAGQLTTGRFDWRTAPRTWQRAVRRLAVALTSDWAGLGLTGR